MWLILVRSDLKQARDQFEQLDKECAQLKQQLAGELVMQHSGSAKNISPPPKAPSVSDMGLLRSSSGSRSMSVVPENLLEAIRKGQQLRHVVRYRTVYWAPSTELFC